MQHRMKKGSPKPRRGSKLPEGKKPQGGYIPSIERIIGVATAVVLLLAALARLLENMHLL